MILLCLGTRPEYIKLKPLMDKMSGRIPYEVLFTGQHVDLLKDIEFNQSLKITNGKNRLDSVLTSVFNKIDFSRYDAVMVQGDTVSAFAIALSAFNNGCKVIHLEAGMRTYDKTEPFPEETYRQCISRLADIHFTPSSIETKHLKDEKVSGEVYEVGNTVLDNLVGTPVSYENEILVTMHRRENHHNMGEWFGVIDRLARENKEYTFTIPLHPNPNVQKHRDVLRHVNVIKPLEYSEMISKISKCKLLLTDSGGIQEEASFLKKMVLLCRKNTERLSLIDKNVTICETPEKVYNEFQKLIVTDCVYHGESPYGDGNTCELIVEKLKGIIR